MMMEMMMRPVSTDGCTEPGPLSLHSTSPVTLHASPWGYFQVHLDAALKINSLLLVLVSVTQTGMEKLAGCPYAACKALYSGLLGLKRFNKQQLSLK